MCLSNTKKRLLLSVFVKVKKIIAILIFMVN